MGELKSNIFDVALIFEGGGMRASYTAGFVNTLLEEEMYFDSVYGLSAGASHVVNYLSRDTDRVKRSFVDLVEDPEFGGVGSWVAGKGFFSAAHIYQEAGLEGGYLPFDMETFAANPASCTIEAFQRDTGKSVYWTQDDLATLPDLMLRVRASSTLPFVMPSPVVEGMHYYDGGLGEGAGFLLPRALSDGFRRFVIVRTRPRHYRKKPPRNAMDKLLRWHYCRRPQLVRALDSRWARYNLVADEIDRLEAHGQAYVFYAKNQLVESGERSLALLEANYRNGYTQAQAELPAIREFLGA